MTQNLGCNHAAGRSIQVTAADAALFTYVYEATPSTCRTIWSGSPTTCPGTRGPAPTLSTSREL
jgi:hypothetical protein